MKTGIKTLLLASVLITPMALHAEDDYGPMMHDGYGYGMMDGYGYGMGPMNLSAEQIEKMQSIRAETMDEMSSMMNKLWKARNKLSKAMRSDNDKAISKAYDELAAAKKQAFMYRLKRRDKMQSVLTKEQKEAFRSCYPRMMMDY
ncbi:Spy/CpxP family protein refolding chaperone [Thiomicrorhabdus sediminis]|uniref:Zinc resistance-associated protein n=1 Tax=Thiomicrorhabdus sediminis TaxID=2580412 RepID=A0A4V1HHJ4_9GAMM|nr:Spy/CpxP family protein refolding chaperone [Thiomicrorhabdus sediminis]QCU89233.1 hypothetical protein FE785_00605 [Thiomicrorhabdus sediminis]